MEVRAVAKYVRVQPRKVRIVADEVRGTSAAHAAAVLRYHPSKSARALRKVLISAIANAANNFDLAPESLKISTVTVDEGPRLKRMHARAMGRGARILKKTSHITVVVADDVVATTVRPHGTKPKARPTFAAPTKGKKKAAKAAKAEEPVAAPEVVEEVAATEEVIETPAPAVETDQAGEN